MIIKKLQLHNFGVYAGDNIFSFEGNKPIVLIGGMNGRGKTTFLEAVLLALYGSKSFAYIESKQKSYLQYLKSFVNKSAEDKTCSIELEFEINNGIKESYIINRQWNLLSKKTKEEIHVYKDGEYNDFLTDNWPMFVENILPSALSSFFFFDGEKIAEMAVDSTNIQLKNAIRSMLGISVLDVLSSDIMRNLKKISKGGENDQTADEVQKLREDKEKALEDLEKIDVCIEELSQIIVDDNDNLEALHQNYTAKGGDAVDQKQEMIQKRADLKLDLSNQENYMYDLSATELPLVLVSDLINSIKLQATDEHEDTVMKQALMHLDDMFENFIIDYKGNIKSAEDFLAYIRQQILNEQTEEIYQLSDQALFQINNLTEGLLKNVKKEASDIIVTKKLLEMKISELDSYLSLDINDNELQNIHKKIKKAEQKLIQDQVKMAELEKLRASANSLVISSSSKFSKYVEAYLSNAELRDSADRTIKYSNMALSIIEKYQVELQRRKTDILAETITDCYKKLANKKNLIQRIEMDPKNLNIVYLSKEGSIVPKDSLSAGEQQLMVISILWALAICSRKKLPVIIDTPLSRLDSLHRTALINTYFPNAGEQTIILSTDSEIDNSYYELMKDNVGDEFTLIYDENTKSTSIKRGYLIGEKI